MDSVKRLSEIKKFFANCIFSAFPYNENIRILSLSGHYEKGPDKEERVQRRMNTPAIETERLILRKFTENDLEAFYLIYSDEEVNNFLPWFPLKTLSLIHI